MSVLRTIDLCIFVQWIIHLYFPFALILFIYRSGHSTIKYRQPELSAVTGTVFCIYTIVLPPLLCFATESFSISSRIVMEWSLVLVGEISYILSQIIVVVKFSITELLLDPRSATEARVNRVQSLRWLLYPRAQILTWFIANSIALIPMFHQTFVSSNFDYTDSHNPWNQALQVAVLVEVVGMIAISWGLTRKISHVVDNFGLRATYLQISKYISGCVLCYGIVSLLTSLDIAMVLVEIHATSMIVMHGAQALCFMLIVIPLRQTYYQVETHREMRIRRRNLQTEIDELEYKVFYRYLCTSDGYAAFLSLCRMELNTDLLLAWNLVEKFKRGEVSIDDIYATVLDPRSEYKIPDISPDVRATYDTHRSAVCSVKFQNHTAQNLQSWRHRVDGMLQSPRLSIVSKMSMIAPAPNPSGHLAISMESTTQVTRITSTEQGSLKAQFGTFFHPLSAELLRLLYLNVLPRFEEYATSSSWITFRNSEKAMVSLDAVDKMVRKTILVPQRKPTLTPNMEDIPQAVRMYMKPVEEIS